MERNGKTRKNKYKLNGKNGKIALKMLKDAQYDNHRTLADK